jgi:autotransporter-associated beta strand protein
MNQPSPNGLVAKRPKTHGRDATVRPTALSCNCFLLSLGAVAVMLGAIASTNRGVAQTWTGSGTTSNWSDPGNWTPSGIPANDGSANVTFDGSKSLAPTIDTAWSVNSVSFAATSSSFVIGGSTLTIGMGGITDNQPNTPTSRLSETINTPIVLAADQTWSVVPISGFLYAGTRGSSIPNNGHTLTIAGNGQILPLAGITGTGGITVNSGIFDAYWSDGQMSFTGPINIAGSGLYVVQESGDLGSSNGSINFNGGSISFWDFGLTVTRNIILNAGGGTLIGQAQTFGGTVTGNISGPGALTIGSEAFITLAGSNSYSGGTNINSNGVLLCTTSTLQGNVNVNGGSLVFTQTANGSYGGNVTGSNSLDIAVGFYGPGVVSWSGTNTYGGVTAIGGTNNYRGPTTTDPGYLRLLSSAALSPNSRIFLANVAGATLDLNGNNATAASIYGGGAIGGQILLGSGTLTTGGDNSSTEFDGVISGTGGVVKVGSGVWTLTGANSYSGATKISAGTIKLTTTGNNNLNSSVIEVDSGAVFDVSAVSGAGGYRLNGAIAQALTGQGSVNGTVTVAPGSHLDPGIGVGTLSMSGLTLVPGSILDYEFNLSGANDFLNISGSNAFSLNGGGINLYAIGSTTPFQTPGTYHLLNYSGAVQGTGVSSLSVLDPEPGRAYLFSNNASLHDIDLTISVVPVPEPPGLLLFACGGMLLEMIRRRGRAIIKKRACQIAFGPQ